MKGKLDTGSFTDFPEDFQVWGCKCKKRVLQILCSGQENTQPLISIVIRKPVLKIVFGLQC